MNTAMLIAEAAPPVDRDGEATCLRIPPHSNEAEQSVLGGLLLDNSAWDRAGDLLTDSDFYRFEHRLIYSAIGGLIAATKPADVITVFEQLQGLGKADECGGMVYLNALAQSVPSAANMRRYAEIVRERAALRTLVAASDEIATSAFNPQGRAVSDIVGRAQQMFADVATRVAPAALLFTVVDAAQLIMEPEVPQEWYWHGYVPAGHVTMLNGHGGVGKSMIGGPLLAACVATGSDCLGARTKQATVGLFTAEDPGDLVMRRLRLVCRELHLDVATVLANLHIIDATEFEPALFVERRVDGIRSGATTATYDALARYVEQHQIQLLIVDNGSDAFDGDEINRAMVRAFIRSLVRLVRPRNGAVLLLAHVDKGTSRAGKWTTNTESYSGSTAWNNSARSRLFLVEKEPGSLELQHQKSNLGPKRPPLAIEWPEHGIPRVMSAAVGPMQTYLNDGDTRALIRLVHEFNGRGESIATSANSRSNAVKLLGDEKTYPKRKPPEVFSLLRDAERDGLLCRESYRDANRKPHERWSVTQKGLEMIGSAPSAPSAPSSEIEAPGPGADGARQVRHVHSRGYGGRARHTPSASDGGNS